MKKIKPVAFIILITLFILNLFTPQVIAKETIDWEEKVNSYNRSINIDPNPMDQFEYAVALANVGEIKKAYDIFKDIREEVDKDKLQQLIEKDIEKIEKNRQDDDLLLLNYQAFLNVIKKDYRESIKYFDKIENKEPDNIWILNFKAASYNELEEYDKSKEILNKALSIEDNKYSHLLMGIAQYYTGNYFKALNEMRKSGDLFGEIISEEDY